MRKTTYFFVMLVIFSMLSLVTIYPVMAQSIETVTSYEYREISIPYGDGIDNNADGVVDDVNETDVTQGNQSINSSMNVIDGWNTTIDTSNGVWIGAYVEAGADVLSSTNGSIVADDTCWYVQDDMGTPYDQQSGCIEVVRYYVNLSPQDIMTGSQETWFRSPIVWDDDIFDTGWNFGYYLNIFNAETNQLVYATPDANQNEIHIIKDESVNGTSYKRVYVKLFFPFRTGTRYLFEEFIVPSGGLPINSIKVFLAQSQDIGNDTEKDAYLFTQSAYARKVPMEPSWSMVCKVGMGRGGNEQILLSNDGADTLFAISDIKTGGENTYVKSIMVVLPLRMSAMANVSMNCYIESGSNYSDMAFLCSIVNLTGTFAVSFNISDPDINAINYYTFTFMITNYGDSEQGKVIAFTAYDSPGSCIIIANDRPLDNPFDEGERHLQGFAMHLEIYEFNYTQGGGTVEVSVKDLKILMGLVDFFVGAILIVAAVLTGWTPMGVMIGGFAIGFFVAGADLWLEAFTDTNLGDLFQGGLRIFYEIINGIAWFIGGLIDVVGKVIAAIINFGEWLVQNGALILDAIWEIIWFIAFLIVMWGVAKLLEIFTAVAELQFGKALSVMERTGEHIWSKGSKYKGKGQRVAEAVYVKGVRRPIVRYGRGMKERRKQYREEE